MTLSTTDNPTQTTTKALWEEADIRIPFEKYVLPNGLTLIVHEDRKAPIVAVNVWYHVGSKNEKPGKSGFAHLFEHLMFNGSEHFNDDYFQALEAIGATDLNGTTSNDRTNYFQNVPAAALDQVLWLESDRMGHMIGAIDQDKLDEQRGVVKNEKRQGENQPYGRQWDLITQEMFPAGHPYSWTVIGSMEDLDDASLEDVHNWFAAYYGAANAVLAIAGDVNPAEVRTKVEKYFGDIPSGPTIVRPEINVPRRLTDTRSSYQDRVPEARITMVWNTPQLGTRQDALLSLAGSILSSGKSSRLFKKLVYTDQVASSVMAVQWGREIAGNFIVQVNVRPGESVDDIERAVVGQIEEFLRDGPSESELERVKAQHFASLIKGMERIGGFGGKSDVLASSQVFGGSPDAYLEYESYFRDATVDAVADVCQKWLATGKFTLVCTPFPTYSTSEVSADRTALPPLGKSSRTRFPELHRTKLNNGLDIVLGQRSGVPTVVMQLLVQGGYSSDFGAKAGTAALAMRVLDEGTKNRSSLELSEELQMLGASLKTGAGLDLSYVGMNALRPTLGGSIDLLADVLMHPAIDGEEFERQKKMQLIGIMREKATPIQMALRVMPRYLFGERHPYSLPFTGSGFEDTVPEISRLDATRYVSKFLRPNNATLVVVGDIGMDALVKMLETQLSGWEEGVSQITHKSEPVETPSNRLFLLDRPESQQSVIVGGYLIAPYGEVSQIGLGAINNVLGGQFISRINMNLREDKHWTYGARSLVADTKGQRPLMIVSSVQEDKTADAIREVRRELQDFIGERPITRPEFEKNMQNTILKLAGRWETNAAVAGSIGEIITYQLDDAYFQTYEDRVREMTLEDIHKLSKEIVRPDRLNWFVVGDKVKIIEPLRELGFDEILLVNGDGELVVRL